MYAAMSFSIVYLSMAYCFWEEVEAERLGLSERASEREREREREREEERFFESDSSPVERSGSE